MDAKCEDSDSDSPNFPNATGARAVVHTFHITPPPNGNKHIEHIEDKLGVVEDLLHIGTRNSSEVGCERSTVFTHPQFNFGMGVYVTPRTLPLSRAAAAQYPCAIKGLTTTTTTTTTTSPNSTASPTTTTTPFLPEFDPSYGTPSRHHHRLPFRWEEEWCMERPPASRKERREVCGGGGGGSGGGGGGDGGGGNADSYLKYAINPATIMTQSPSTRGRWVVPYPRCLELHRLWHDLRLKVAQFGPRVHLRLCVRCGLSA